MLYNPTCYYIHIDEKWFYLTKKLEHYYLLPDEEDPIRTYKSKTFIENMIFLIDMAHARFDEQKNETLLRKRRLRESISKKVAGIIEPKPITLVKKKKNIIRS